MSKPLRLTAHAEIVAAERGLEIAWIERAVRTPEWSGPDPVDPAIERRFLPLPECQGRVLRVVCVEVAYEIRILTAFLDRRAQRPR